MRLAHTTARISRGWSIISRLLDITFHHFSWTIMGRNQTIVTGLLTASLVLATGLVCAAGQYGPGVSDTEIKIGNAMPYSGAASALGATGKSEAAHFNMINDQGGINGRKIKYISRDDSYSPPKTVEVVRKLVEQDQAL
jgi:ABC-type branched-subunit amino acid transport system substrate-binding protein